MNLLPKSCEEFSCKEYWNSFFKKRGKKSFEWYGEYQELSTLLLKYIKFNDNILIVGCGNSTLSMCLYDSGYRNIINIDVSYIVIQQMRDINKKTRPDLIYEHMDAMQMTYPSDRFQVIIDKGTLDALMPDTKKTTITMIDKYFKEITRVLQNGGRYICISLLQEHILQKLLSYFPAAGFMVRILRCFEVELKAYTEEDNLIPIFMIVATKATKLRQQVLEITLTDGPLERLSSIEEMTSAVISAQTAALMCNTLPKRNIADVGEIVLELHKWNDNNPRYRVYLVDQPCKKYKTYAAFIVPQGKEVDWLFSTKEGRQQILKTSQQDRLAIVTLCREHKFNNLETVKSEVATCILNLMPANLRGKNFQIPYLSLGSDLGDRITCYEGNSDINGAFVVEDVMKDDHEYRRLIFLSNPYAIQSEARLKEVKSRRGKLRKVIDPGFLGCQHHVHMCVGVNAVINPNKQDEILIIGLGGGGLCTFLHQCFPKLKITAVEIDNAMLKVATQFFNLTLDNRMRVEIADGIQFVKDAMANGKKYKAILFDINSKDTTIGMSCPPLQFLEIPLLKAVEACLMEDGLFLLNLVSRDTNLKQKIEDDLNSVFQSIIFYKIKENVNEIVICSIKKHDPKEWKAKLRCAVTDLNEQTATRKLSSFTEATDISMLLESFSLF